MADEDLALEGAQADDAQALPAEDEQQAETSPYDELASKMGWAPKDQFKGDPDKWKPADQFILDGRDIQQTTSRELRGVREQLERISGVTETIVRDKVAEARSQWERELERAVDEGDHAAARKAANELAKPVQPSGPAPDVQSWIAKNEWFTKDSAARLRAQEVSDKLAAQNIPVAEQLEAAERIVRKEFPEHFPAPAKPPPSTNTAQSRNANPGNRQKGFNDMPVESQAVARDFERLNGLPKEKFAEQYWTNEASKRVRA